MKLFRILLISFLVLLVVSSTAMAMDFDWTRNFNVQAKADPSGFREKIAARFGLSGLQAMALRNIFASPADAYIMLRFGEIKGVLKKLSKEDGKAAIKTYRNYKSKGWNVLAQIMGVDTKCKEYLALKNDQDLFENNDRSQVAYSSNSLRSFN